MSIQADLDQQWAMVRDWIGEQTRESLIEMTLMLAADGMGPMIEAMRRDHELADRVAMLALTTLSEGLVRYAEMKGEL